MLGARKSGWWLIVAAILVRTLDAAPAHGLDPREAPFFAAPGDDADDRVALQAWIDAGCASPRRSLVLPPGVWHVTRRPVPGPENAGSLQIRCDGLTISGAGTASRIVMTGSARLSPTSGPTNWSAFAIRANRVTLANFVIDGGGRRDTGEQTHLVQIDGPSRGTRLRALFLVLPILPAPPGSVPCKAEGETEKATRMCVVPGPGKVRCESLGHKPHCTLDGDVFTLLGWFQGGDCIRSVGRTGAPVEGVEIRNIVATVCARSFVSLQHESRDITITGNVTQVVGGQIVDLEPSGTSGIRNVTIQRNRFARGLSTPRLAAISLAGTGTDASQGILVSGNVLEGGVLVANASGVTIRKNRMTGRHALSDKAIVDINRATGVQVEDNEIERDAAASPGRVVDIRGTNVRITRNTLRQRTADHVIAAGPARRVRIVGNTIVCEQPPVIPPFVALHRRAAVTTLLVTGNRIIGSCAR
jgi:hypothetical protein